MGADSAKGEYVEGDERIAAYLWFEFSPSGSARDCVIAFTFEGLTEQAVVREKEGWGPEFTRLLAQYGRKFESHVGYVRGVGFRPAYFLLSSNCERSNDIAKAFARYANHAQSDWLIQPSAPGRDIPAEFASTSAAEAFGVTDAELKLRRSAFSKPCSRDAWIFLADLYAEREKQRTWDTRPNEIRFFGINLYRAWADMTSGQSLSSVLDRHFADDQKAYAKKVLALQKDKHDCGR